MTFQSQKVSPNLQWQIQCKVFWGTSMEGLPKNIFCYCAFLFLLLTKSAALDTIAANQAIRDGDTIVSANEMFELGFFSPGNSKNQYVGIWYKNISPQTVVWVANRDMPLTNTSGMLKVSDNGTLLLVSSGDTMIWSSRSADLITVSVSNINPVAQLLDSGNLVVRDKRRIDQETLIWQSFDNMDNTLLPGVKLGKDLVTGTVWWLSSWKSHDDPSPGEYVNYIDTNGFPQIIQRRVSIITFRLGPWNGLRFSGFPSENPNPIFTYEFVYNEKEIYYKYDLINSSHLSRVYLSPEGSMLRLNWLDHTQSWFLYLSATVDSCSGYGFCGPNGFCNTKNSPLCSCMEGFEPKRQEEWDVAAWSSGCQLKEPLDCGAGEGFWKISGVKFPDTRRSWYNLNMTLGECEMACRRNCSCTAYSNVDVRKGGSGCLLWFDELMDVRACEETQHLYIRMAASELTGIAVSQAGFNNKIRVFTIVLSISSSCLVLLGLSAVVYACSNKKKTSRVRGRGPRVHALAKHYIDVQKEDLEVPFFGFSNIAKATNNFSIVNKLGEGGFGPVYKGVLGDGREIAVKRLSHNSAQGLDEFQNEVICVAKLQH